ncbi:MAG: PIN domain-containing protein [Rhodospirillales bacterium]|nr:PIN domain-containing protein [Rhodospirillales bacterium]MBI2585306.1 PIN domain-containing protein [Rhodospirillales bacterium]
MRLSFDTNLLVYAADVRAGDRHHSAAALVQRAVGADCVLCLQSLAEFFYAVTRKRLMTLEDAARTVDRWRAVFPVYAASEECLADAMNVHRKHRFPFWDAMLWATAREAGCRILLSEDFQDGLRLGGLRCVNPFAAANQALLDAALPAAD